MQPQLVRHGSPLFSRLTCCHRLPGSHPTFKSSTIPAPAGVHLHQTPDYGALSTFTALGAQAFPPPIRHWGRSHLQHRTHHWRHIIVAGGVGSTGVPDTFAWHRGRPKVGGTSILLPCAAATSAGTTENWVRFPTGTRFHWRRSGTVGASPWPVRRRWRKRGTPDPWIETTLQASRRQAPTGLGQGLEGYARSSRHEVARSIVLRQARHLHHSRFYCPH